MEKIRGLERILCTSKYEIYDKKEVQDRWQFDVTARAQKR
jgi:hypothetical protein